MNKKYSLKGKKNIEKLLKIKKSLGNKYYVLYYIESNDTKIAVSVSKKVGTAVERNYQKRVMKEILRKNMNFLIGKQLLIVCKVLAKDLKFKEKEEQILYLLRKVK